MIIERHFGGGYREKAKAFAAQCKGIRGLYVQEYHVSGCRYAVRVSGDALTPELAEKLLAGHKNCSKSAKV